jgi:hypothetical protein
VYSASNDTGSSYQAIIDAFNNLRLSQGETAKGYQPNYQGIIKAILDLKKWGQAGSGETPPGWYPIIDDDGNVIDGGINPAPANGTLWFDTRQGRLFVWIDDGFYQTNGADGLASISETVPDSEVAGSFWYNTTNDTLYIYDGTTWTIAASGGAGAVNTAGLMLANPTRQVLQTISSRLPDHNNAETQADMNAWTVQAIALLDTVTDELGTDFPTFSVNSRKPDSATRGDFWFNTSKVELMMWYDGNWVPTHLPLLADDTFTQLATQVQTNHASVNSRLAAAIQRLQSLENQPLRELYVGTNYNNSSLVFNDNRGGNSEVTFRGLNGIQVTANGGTITVDGTNLKESVEALVSTSGTASAIAALSTRTGITEQLISALQDLPVVDVNEFTSLSNVVSSLPTRAELNQKVGMNGAVFSDNVSFNDHRLRDVAQPQEATDGVNRLYVDNLRSYTDQTFIRKTGSTLSNISINRADLSNAAIDFSQSPTQGINAFKFKTYGGPGTVSFGLTTKANEYAWEFSGDEEFAWIGSNGKVATVNKNSLVAKDLVIGDFVPNSDQPLILNKIDVKERLTNYQTALQGVRSALTTATTFDEFKTLAHTALSNI